MTPDEVPPERDVVAAFAAALDADDFGTAAALIDPKCIYEIEGTAHHGPDEILASYEKGSNLARDLFDSVEYGHRIVGQVTPGTYRVRYIDLLSAGRDSYRHTTEQDLTVRLGRVVRIENRPIPGEREKLDAFMAQHEIRRP